MELHGRMADRGKQTVMHRCPACSGPVRAALADRDKKVRCPSCRKVVVLEPAGHSETPVLPGCAVEIALPSRPGGAAGEDPNEAGMGKKENANRRLDTLEKRVAGLEQALAEALRAGSRQGTSRLKWLAQTQVPDLSAVRADALCHNLTSISAHRITILFPAGNEAARQRAQWFKLVFERAQWPVKGPEDAETSIPRDGLVLTTTLPVSPQAAATFMALRAAGFLLDAAFDPGVEREEECLVVA